MNRESYGKVRKRKEKRKISKTTLVAVFRLWIQVKMSFLQDKRRAHENYRAFCCNHFYAYFTGKFYNDYSRKIWSINIFMKCNFLGLLLT